ncbi:hypothetical protein Hanom_Chr02g00138041 [Helianthus anomalus]
MEIRSFKWCEYMIRCLDRTVEAWSRNDCFLGPMPLLVACSECLHNFLNTHLD